MMKPISKMTFEATMELSEAEVRVLAHLASYSSGLTKAIQQHVTTNFSGSVLTDLLNRWRLETAEFIRRVDAAKRAFDETPKG